MNIDIIDFYPGKKPKDKKYVGTLHVYLEDYDLDVRGVDVKRYGDKIFYNLPKRKTWDPEQKKVITFDVLSFTDPKKKELLISQLREKATDLVFQRLSARHDHKTHKHKS